MSFINQNLSVLAYANGFTLWNYNTEDDLATVKSLNYFNDISSFARIGDMILTVANKSADIASAVLVVSAIANGVVTVKSITA